jgi:hypothetical protein
MTKVISTVEIVGSNAMELQAAITKLIANARIASNGQNWSGGSAIDIENDAGLELAQVDLIEETLSDSSKVYNIQLRFSNV